MNIWSTGSHKDNIDIRREISKLSDDQAIFQLAGILMQASENKTLSKLFMFFNSDRDSLFRFLEIFGGEKVTVPRLNDLIHSLKLIKLIYLYDFKDWSFSNALREAGFEESQRKLLIKQRSDLIESLRKSQADETT